MTSFLVSLWICSKLVVGRSCGSGWGRLIFSKDLLELFLSKVLVLLRGALLKVGTYEFSSSKSSSSKIRIECTSEIHGVSIINNNR